MGSSKKSILKAINSLEKQIKEHQLKILDAIENNKNIQCIEHWEKEIDNFRDQIDKLKRKLKR
jgi:peptidoglycan hydrolase CwlO-like protein